MSHQPLIDPSPGLLWPHAGVERLVQRYADGIAERSGTAFALDLPDGTRWRAGAGDPSFTIAFHDESALLALLTRGHMGLLESYFDGRLNVQGDLGAALASGMTAGVDQRHPPLNTLENNLHEWRHSNASPAQAKANARAHYGLPVEFYRRWLDEPLMMYTCGYWPEGTHTLEQAQQRKIDHVCRKIRLAGGERFVDIGCGFGGFMFRAHETTGATRGPEHQRPSRSTGCARRSCAAAWRTRWPCARPTSDAQLYLRASPCPRLRTSARA